MTDSPGLLVSAAALAVGVAGLAFAAKHLVLGGAGTASSLRVSPMLVGALVIGFGTSSPELLVSALASWRGLNDVAVGNVVGSNVANLTLVLGVGAVAAPLAVRSPTLRREAPISAVSAFLLAAAVFAGLSRGRGTILLAAFAAAAFLIVRGAREPDVFADEVQEFMGDPRPLKTEVPRTIAGMAGTIIFARVLIYGAEGLAAAADLSQGFIGLILVALGTSLPELATAIQGARKREGDLVLGNILGSNVFNSLAIGGVASVIRPGPIVDVALMSRGLLFMMAVSTLTLLAMRTGMTVTRKEGMGLIGAYVVFVGLIVG